MCPVASYPVPISIPISAQVKSGNGNRDWVEAVYRCFSQVLLMCYLVHIRLLLANRWWDRGTMAVYHYCIFCVVQQSIKDQLEVAVLAIGCSALV